MPCGCPKPRPFPGEVEKNGYRILCVGCLGIQSACCSNHPANGIAACVGCIGGEEPPAGVFGFGNQSAPPKGVQSSPAPFEGLRCFRHGRQGRGLGEDDKVVNNY